MFEILIDFEINMKQIFLPACQRSDIQYFLLGEIWQFPWLFFPLRRKGHMFSSPF